MAYDIGEAFQKIEDEMLASMSRNLKRHLNKEKEEGLNYSMWQAEQLKSLDEFKRNNAEAFKDYFGIVNEQLGEILKKCNENGQIEQEAKILEAIQEGWKIPSVSSKGVQGSFFKINERKLNSLVKATKSDMAKAEAAMLRQANDVYRKTIFNAQVYYNTGAGTLSQCVDMATKDFLARGITCVEYANGTRVGIDSYARMVLRTSQTRAYLMGESSKRDEWGINTVIVNKRGVACPLCLKWVGKVFYDDVWGSTPVPSPAKYPRLSTAIEGGLYHPNCRDIHTTYFEGISTPPKPMTKDQVDEANRVYALEQRQRYNERQIRKYKRLAQGSVDPDNVVKYSEKLQQWQNEQKQFINAHSDVLKRRAELEKVFDIPENLQWGQKTYDFSQDNHDIILKKESAFRKIDNKHTIEDDIGTHYVPKCNPRYRTRKSEYTSNCGYCSATYEMRRRGNDVIARPRIGMYVADWMKLFKNSVAVKLTSKRADNLATELQTKLSAMGNGARGSLYVLWKGRSVGHFFSWEVENGTVRFVDAQTGETDVSRYIHLIHPTRTICLRWDNLEPSDMIKEACKNRGGD